MPVADIEAIRERQRQRDRAQLRSRPPHSGMVQGSAAEAVIQRYIDAVAQSGEGARHPTYLEQSARARAICERAGIDWSSVAARLKSAYLGTLTAQEAAQRQRGSIDGVPKWLDRRART